MDASILFPAETLARQLLNERSDFTASEYILVTARTLVESLDAITAKKRSDLWTVSKKFPPIQTFPKHSLHFMSMFYKDEGLLQ